MDEEIEDIVGDVRYTDSQKSLTMNTCSNTYSPDFTDSSSDKNTSTGKETYIIESWVSEDSDPISLCRTKSVIDLFNPPKSPVPVNSEISIVTHEPKYLNRGVCTSQYNISLSDGDTFTQTSKTILELAEADIAIRQSTEYKTLETQTSFISITENKTVEYRIEVSNDRNVIFDFNVNSVSQSQIDARFTVPATPTVHYIESIIEDSCTTGKTATYSHEESDRSDRSPSESESDKEVSEDNSSRNEGLRNTEDTKSVTDDNNSDKSSKDPLVDKVNNRDSDSDVETNKSERAHNVSFEESSRDSEIEEDSLIETGESTIKNSDDVDELHDMIKKNRELNMIERFGEPNIRRFGTLTPLTEESNLKKDSLLDITPNVESLSSPKSFIKDEVLFTNSVGLKVKVLKDADNKTQNLKLPPIQNHSCPSSPHLSNIFMQKLPITLCKAGTLPCLNTRQKEKELEKWESSNKQLAAGESSFITERNVVEPVRRQNGVCQLPPIHLEGHNDGTATDPSSNRAANVKICEPHSSISIGEKIKELKMSKNNSWPHTKYTCQSGLTTSRSCSPCSVGETDMKLSDVAERGCDTLCSELLRRLRSSFWTEVLTTLEEIPIVLEKFWGVISETRIADLIRQVNIHIDSPRPQVARCACTTVASILKNTCYTKKPDFSEALAALLLKTGSYNRPVRRAANMALDEIVCGIELTEAVTALCVHGAGHKNPLVRCASARLLVVGCALAGGGRDLLRARPTSAASARRHVLRTLAALLDDKSTDTRKYAERLYSMLRPLTNFEAYYLTDNDVELASKQIKKYDQLLLCGSHKETPSQR